MLAVLGAVIGHAMLRGHGDDRSERLSRRISWGALAAGGVLLCLEAPLGLTLGVCLCACICRLSGWRLALRCLCPLLLMLVVAWRQEYLYMTMSLPMSRICASFAGWVIRGFGVEVVVDKAAILVGEELVAVTAACSGVELLEVSLLLGWFVIRRHPAPAWMQAAHYVMLLPFVIVCNTLRLVGGILLYLRIGISAFQDPWHTLFGYMVLVAVLLMMLLTGWLLYGGESGSDAE